ncbi:glycine zipper domain-containing protein [Chenggangzhangella methanolivorans]|uniref:Cell envelope biogenesis protein OmpA n=1 Tax=Chenggangzhangella methanolivorans TaxID=1437009 RepID=A0A9E6RF41_9HYPH|nr:glycine zipper domain-containing protein [Chenggangzhangella methanolivorans]QZO00066.1 cell envelope biogenesis protein OmpA [Chenggangzhangella methanolivorans]
MKKVGSLIAVSALALGLAACGETRNERTLSGALIGTAAGAAIGGAVTGKAGGALVGGALGAGTGAIIGSQTRGPRCYARNRYGERYRVPCD